MTDTRRNIARYYDVGATWTDDIDFYAAHIPPDDRTILELGCGTGRVLVPLSRYCDYIVGVDHSSSMLAFCEEKLQKHGIPQNRAALFHEDISCMALQSRFGLVIAPFRVFQNADTDEKVDTFFRSIHRHLSPHGSCILTVFRPNAPASDLVARWRDHGESLSWERPLGSGLLRRYYRKSKISTEPLVLYPELVYRYYEDEALVDEARDVVPMRVYYADEFKEVIQSHGFRIVGTWGGYHHEEYDEGPELIVKFTSESDQQNAAADLSGPCPPPPSN